MANRRCAQSRIETGKVLESVSIAQNYFGEGITLLGGKIYQLTWKEQVCLVLRCQDFAANRYV